MIPTPAPQPPYLRKAKASPPSAIAPANRSQNDRPAPAPHPPHSRKAKRSQNDRTASVSLPLSQREQQVCEYLSQGISFEAIANHLSLSPAAARAYYRRALSKRQRTIASASLEQGDSSAPRVRSTAAKPELAVDLGSGYLDVRTCKINILKIAESLQSLERKHRTNSTPDQIKALEGDESAKGWDFVGRSPNPQTTITELPRHLRLRKPYSRRTRRTGVGFRLALAS